MGTSCKLKCCIATIPSLMSAIASIEIKPNTNDGEKPVMSKQLSVSAFASIAAMALFALTSGMGAPAPNSAPAGMIFSAPTILVD